MRMTAILFLWTIVISCEVKKSESPLQSHTLSQTTIRYAEGFSVQYQGNNKLVEVKQPFQGAASGQKYLLVPRGEIATKPESDVDVIHVPIRSIVCWITWMKARNS
jgi:iron complex transport system substrate-binding protein